MISIDRINSVENLNALENYNSVETYSEGVNLAEQFFTDFHEHPVMEFPKNGELRMSVNYLKKFQIRGKRDYDVKVYECYTDSSSIDYFHFSFEQEV